MNVYLDNAATTPLTMQVKQYIIELLDVYGNPSSLYQLGVESKRIIEQSRSNIAKFINANPENIIFTPSGSASNTLAIRGYLETHSCSLFYSPLLHKSALKYIKSVYCNAEELMVDKNGFILINDLENKIKSIKEKPFFIMEYANSEVGTIQDVKEIIDIIHEYGGIVYLDCTGSISTIPLDVKYLNVDMAGFSAHKLGALKGCGVLYKKSSIELQPLIYGTQEMGISSGTENILGIASLGKAVENYDYSSITSRSRDYVYDYIVENIPDSYLVGASFDRRLPHNLYMCFKGIQGESLMILMDMSGIQISTGSACSSGDLTPSSTLVAIGMDKEDINSCVRLSFSGLETKEELDYVCKKLKDNIEKLRNINM